MKKRTKRARKKVRSLVRHKTILLIVLLLEDKMLLSIQKSKVKHRKNPLKKRNKMRMKMNKIQMIIMARQNNLLTLMAVHQSDIK